MFLILLNSQCNDAFIYSPGCVQFLQYYYQRGCLYRLRALGERNHLDLTVGEVVCDALFAKLRYVRQKGQVWEAVIPRWLCGLQRFQICYPPALLPLVQRQEWWQVFYHPPWVLWGGNGVL